MEKENKHNLNRAGSGLLSSALLFAATMLICYLYSPKGELLQPIIPAAAPQMDASVWYARTLTIALALFLFAALLLIQCLNIKREVTASILCLAIGCIYLFTMSPLSIPDERAHYSASLLVSNTMMQQSGNVVEEEYLDFEGLKAHYNTSSSYVRAVEEFGGKIRNSRQTVVSDYYRAEYPLAFVPQALGITVARLLGFNFITTFVIGRFFNLLFYTVCVYCAIRMIPRFKTLMFLIAFMPMALHQAASFSYDSMINGMALLLTAMLFRAILAKETMTAKRMLAIAVISAVQAPIKLVYIFILLLYLAIPEENFYSKKQKYVSFAGIMGLSVAAILLFRMAGLRSSTIAAGADLNWEGKQNYSLSFIFEHPLKTAEILMKTVRFEGLWLMMCCVGRAFAGLTIFVSDQETVAYMACILLAGICASEDSENNLYFSARCACVLAAGMVFLAVSLTMFLNWTSNTSDVVQGLQGRYFIPAAILIPVLFNSSKYKMPAIADRIIQCCAVSLNAVMLFHILSATLYM